MNEVLTFTFFGPWLVVGKKNVIDSTEEHTIIDKPLVCRAVPQPDGSSHVFLGNLPGYPERVKVRNDKSQGSWESDHSEFTTLYIKKTTNLTIPDSPGNGGGKVIRL